MKFLFGYIERSADLTATEAVSPKYAFHAISRRYAITSWNGGSRCAARRKTEFSGHPAGASYRILFDIFKTTNTCPETGRLLTGGGRNA